MDYVNLGKTGLKVSRLCLGCMSYGTPEWREWVLDEKASRPFFKKALDHGITFFDTADIYSKGASEEITGRLLLEYAPRDSVVIATKVGLPMSDAPNQSGLGRKHIMASIDASLKRLGTDHVDLYQIHRFDPETPVEETMEALDDVVRAGKARHIGASSMLAYQFVTMQATAERHGWSRFVSMQNHYNLIYREEEREMIPHCREEGIGIIPWSPLARGMLAGTRKRGGARETVRADSDPIMDKLYTQESDFDVVERVAEVAAARGVKPAQIALAWILHKPGVTAPIVGATKLHHLDDLIAAQDIALDEAEIEALEAPYAPHPVMNFFPNRPQPGSGKGK